MSARLFCTHCRRLQNSMWSACCMRTQFQLVSNSSRGRAVCPWHRFRAYRVRADWVDQWGSPHSPAKHKAAVDKLTQLQLLKHSSSQRASRLDPRGIVFDLAYDGACPTCSLPVLLIQTPAAEMFNLCTPYTLTFRSSSRQPKLAVPGSLSRCG